ncbi:sigma-54 dependent transcriptional regulator [Deferribacter thermophilus]|uniref:sigma-54-dependent transcriptional regulator n=1 Tax=Deferribacter thermophilus TaxID=53573 RepID=UPI003C22BA4E
MKVLIIDDEKNICETLKDIVEDEGFNADFALNFNDGFNKLKNELYDILFLDIWLPDKDGNEGLIEIKKYFPDLEVIMISGHGNIENAVESIKHGAYDYLEKPLSLERILLILKHLKDKILLERDLRETKLDLLKKYDLIGISDQIQALKRRIEKIAPTNAWVLITGENGTGKEHVARLIHLLSKRSKNRFVELNCSAVPSELIESEMFGYEKGAFTGAVGRKAGKFELADKGTLFLDEIGDMDLMMQAKLLRVLETFEFSRIGGNDVIRSDFRLISATNKNIEKEIEKGNFRKDLYYRINVVPIHVPPLRERKVDIPLLVEFFVKESCYNNGFPVKRVSDELMELFINYDWPGNVRQLKNTIERMVVLSDDDILKVEDAPGFLKGVKNDDLEIISMGLPLKVAKELFEKNYILKVLKSTDWNISKAAKVLKIERTYLHKKINHFNLKNDK